MIDFIEYYKTKGHVFGECMTKPDIDLMYINIPKNASSWTKPNLKDWGWEFYNYHTDKLNKHALVVLRDPVERWLSGIAEYMTLYHPNVDPTAWFELIFDRIAFDDHTESQVLFLQGIKYTNCTFFLCDENFKSNFSDYLNKHDMPNSYDRYENQHVTANSPERTRFKDIFTEALQNSKYKQKVEWYFEKDYKLLRSVQFYAR